MRGLQRSLVALAGLVVVAAGCSPPAPPAGPGYVDSPECAAFTQAALPVRSLGITDGVRVAAVQVEVAANPEERGRGLMCRAAVPGGTGMAFVWDQPTSAGFWMYNTHVPLDLLFVDGGGRVIAVRSMKPCPRRVGEESPAWTARCAEEARPYSPGTPYLVAIELPGGWLETLGFDPAGHSAWTVEFR